MESSAAGPIEPGEPRGNARRILRRKVSGIITIVKSYPWRGHSPHHAIRGSHQLDRHGEPERLHAAHLARARRAAPGTRHGGRGGAGRLGAACVWSGRPPAGAVTGLLAWAAFLGSGARPLAWTAVALLMVAVGLGLCTVTLWTPYPARNPGERRPAAP